MRASSQGLELCWSLRMSAPAQVRECLDEGIPESCQPQAAVLDAYFDWRDGRLAEALTRLDEAEVALRTADDRLWLARALNVKGVVLQQLSQGAQALTLFQEQLSLAQQIGDTEMEGIAHNDIGVLLIWDDPERARARYQMALDIFSADAENQQAGIGLAAYNLSVAHFELGNRERSAELLIQAEAAILTAKAWPYWVGVMSQWAMRLAEEGQTEQARELFSKARGKWADLPGDSRQLLVFYEAKVELESGRADTALERFTALEAWMQTRHDMLDEYLSDFAQACALGGDHEAAYTLMVRAYKSVGDRHRTEQEMQLKALETVHRSQELQRQSEAQQHYIQQLETVQGELHRVSVTDELSGVSNRRRFLTWGEDQRRQGFNLALAFIDIDHFKTFNDSAGHEYGDHLIRQLGQLLVQTIGMSTLVARLGGDEFVVAQVADDTQAMVQHMHAVQRACVSELRGPGGQFVTLSIGVTRVCGDLTDGLRSADQAMYRAKQLGRDRIYVFE